MHERAITDSLHRKIQEAIDGTAHLVSLVPSSSLTFRPRTSDHPEVSFTDMGHLLGHLLECLSGFCAALRAAFPAELEDFEALRNAQVDRECAPNEALEGIRAYKQHIARGLAICTDESLARQIPTVFVPEGETLLTLLLGNLEHLLNHKMQLFLYLKLLGEQVKTADLYTLRGLSKKG